MVARLFTELGLPVRHLTQHDHLPLDPSRSFGVFHVHEARGSTYIPDQHRFVEPFGVRSVVGYGGSFADERLFAVILFLRTPVDREHAECFRLLSDATRDVLSAKHSRPLFQP